MATGRTAAVRGFPVIAARQSYSNVALQNQQD